MNIGDLLAPERVHCQTDVSSKKRALEMLGEMLSNHLPKLTQGEIFDSLLARERLGSTGLGHGVAIPHGRLAGASEACAALLKLEKGVDYDAPDSEPVDILFALVVPADCTDEHLQILALLARMFSDPETLARLRSTSGPSDLLTLVREWDTEAPG
ncbi:PTS sugar transporter subunit IIA [Ectothiorhodospira haloalkaliphila]|uniref:PTS sugar transporter subunit IIA n=1 Tax=Ectothiorhodospira haloalkaliphila TaxID=421628 RepID=W8L2S3_9GAMM|nr:MULTISPECIES: PTS sugar transporter subunit IIA [Ectothiorhodospira]AHK78220.1 PTS sugar transporter subunit IIA [Ectothiorhodospira haloalkaliphila]MCG5493439.1 PTS sugar transporter subunit IIA [Ectothiorhodospira variabilis]MCG5496785.1 PTS sugar transporter subunit IIA [Ectothiorhodospira variabilis]MCG5502768.1 PTS sugar transporter subunit IIA [Ectothiorhodospira variabilis]MCG5505466.1 PTS sugar transporter subunit IIA [Ectothiorhodospira variabilis]